MANITYIRIDDEVYALHDDNALTSDSNLDASKVVGTLPANTYTNTTYESKAAIEGGTDVSLVTTGDKYRWNNASSGGVSDVEVNGSSVVSGGVAEITVPTKTSDLTNDSNFQNATQVDSAINTRIASVYKAKGSVAFLDLPALTSSNEGFVYDVNESFTTTSDFVEGAGKTYPAGTNVVIIDTGSGVYKYDVLAGLVDLSGKQDTLVSGTNIKTINNTSLLGSGNISIPTGLQNLVDGSSTDSVRGIGTAVEDSSYTMGNYAMAEGLGTKASGMNSHAEGYSTTASGMNSHAEGSNTEASGMYVHAEGLGTKASGYASHAEGDNTTASGYASHAEGFRTEASNAYAHAQNRGTVADHSSQTAIGKYNNNQRNTAFEIGNGTDDNNRSNAFAVDWDGNTVASGNITDGNGNVLSDKADSTDLADYLPLTGGTLTGALTENDVIYSKNNNFERDTGGTLNEGFRIVDKNGDTVAYMKGLSTLDSQDRTIEGFNIGTSRVVGSSTIWNSLRMMIDADGNPVVTIGQPDAWREALGLAESDMPTFRGIKFVDSTGFEYPIWDNGTNLWIGSSQSGAQHHRGMTFISAGYDGTDGYKSIRISVPNAANDGASNYDVLHTGYEPDSPSISISATVGTLSSYSVRRFGKVVQLLLRIQKSTATPAGSNLFEGTINTTGLRPSLITSSGTYYGQQALIGTIAPNGGITIRNASSTSQPAITGNNNANISFTYLVE